MEERQRVDVKTLPMSVYQIHAGTWQVPGNEDAPFENYRQLAEKLAAYVLEMGYTHVELLPIMEHSEDRTLGFATTAYYAPTSRYGSAQDFMYFVENREAVKLLHWLNLLYACKRKTLKQSALQI